MELTTKALAAHVRTFSEYLQKVGSALFEEAFKVRGVKRLSIQQLRYLELIEACPGITPGDLAKRFAVTKPTVSNVILALERLDLISKKNSDSDARVYKLYPREEARRIFEKRRGMYVKLARHIQGRLDRAGLESLVSLFEAITKGGLDDE
jgi:DNA-binding MarR family transcriptional regulator